MNYNLVSFLSKRKAIFCAMLMFASMQQSTAQHKALKVLFLGNAFTETNMLPIILNSVAISAGDTLITEWNAPMGASFREHSSDFTSIGKMSTGLWNYVVLQEDGRKPALSDMDVMTEVTPYAAKLDSMVHKFNKCGRSVIFQTWGFENGDPLKCASFPPICTYKGMDSLLELRYQSMANDNNALLAPVGFIFNKIRNLKPSLNLYLPDGENPSALGTYAAAVTLYTILFRNDPNLVTFNYSISPADAAFIRTLVFTNIYSLLPKYFVGKYDPNVNFTSSVVGKTVTFNTSSTLNAINYNWDFGDGGTSMLANPTHTYAAAGIYNVRLIGDDCIIKDTAKNTVEIMTIGGIQESSILNSIAIYPNPATSVLNFEANFSLKNVNVSLVNVMGTEVLSKPLNSGILNVSSLSKGMYIIQLKDQATGATITKKFIKE